MYRVKLHVSEVARLRLVAPASNVQWLLHQDLRVDDVDVSFRIFTTELPAASCVKASQATNQHFTIQRLKVKEKGSGM